MFLIVVISVNIFFPGQRTSVTQTTSAINQVGIGQTVDEKTYAQASKGQLEVVGQVKKASNVHIYYYCIFDG